MNQLYLDAAHFLDDANPGSAMALRLTARSSVWQWTERLDLLQNDASIASACRHHAGLMADDSDTADRNADLIETLQPRAGQ